MRLFPTASVNDAVPLEPVLTVTVVFPSTIFTCEPVIGVPEPVSRYTTPFGFLPPSVVSAPVAALYVHVPALQLLTGAPTDSTVAPVVAEPDVVNDTSLPSVGPAAFVATSWTWYVVPALSPDSAAVTAPVPPFAGIPAHGTLLP